MTTQVSFKSKAGSDVVGALAEPSGDGKVGTVVLVQEYWGINDHIKSLVDRLAKEGFLVVAPDLYHGKIATDSAEAGKLMTELDTVAAVGEIAGAVAYLKEHPRSNGKVGVVGFCLGGALTFASTCFIPDLAAAVPFYGVPPAEKVDYSKVTAPIQAHFAKTDAWASVDKAEAIKAQVKDMELHIYDAQHAFVNDSRPEVYSPDNAKVAWERTVAFFKKHLA